MMFFKVLINMFFTEIWFFQFFNTTEDSNIDTYHTSGDIGIRTNCLIYLWACKMRCTFGVTCGSVSYESYPHL